MDATTTPAPYRDLTRIVLSVLGIGLLLAGSFWVLRPFLPALLWAVMITVTTWPIMLRLQRRLGGRRGGAIAIMTVALLLLLFVPLYLAVATILAQSDRIVALVRSLPDARVPPPPAWVGAVPLVGPAAAERWLELASLQPQELTARLAPHVRTALTWFAARAGGFGGLVFHFLLTIAITAVLYAKGEGGANLLLRFFRRLSGDRGDAIVILAGKAIRAVALGIIVTALVQTAIAALGLIVTGVPFAGVIAAVVFILCIAQLGPILALVPCVIWLYATGAPGRGTLLLVVTLAAQTFDNVLRPLLIKRGGAELSLLIIFPGVIGGLLWLGIGGLFVGPVVLAVTWTLLQSWIATGLGESAASAVPAIGPPGAGAGDGRGGGETRGSAR